ncbi:phosphate acetyltransferase [Ignavigranum ruoffiae]|uniref:Phosphate acetyltransferase n=1 Tax=Ignavigranum ruoffiae TaxID=89093 RepID=A0A1H9GLH0_9LACT|nr:phosphate acetyltransferase [Ignavigranum ruoffiae]SEQ50972.1 phosphate acetyltransferase [Ignavigranum ruoffiae]
MGLFEDLSVTIKGKGKRLVFPEGHDARVLAAVVRLKEDQLLDPILVGNPEEIKATAQELGKSIEGIELLDPNHYEQFDSMVEDFVERRKGKATVEQAQEILKDKMYFATMLVYQDLADGLVAGATQSTGSTVKPALQIIKTRAGVSSTSGVFILVPENEDEQKYVFGDCAININPTAEQLAEIAIESAKTAEIFNIDPKVALLSFSTKGSASSPEVDKVVEATKLAKEKAPELVLDGELQFDAAISDVVGQAKAPGSPVAGQATVFIFPEIQSGNIGYKIAQRLGGYQALGPILQGMAKPVTDLSRGCNEEDVYKAAIITANQALLQG